MKMIFNVAFVGLLAVVEMVMTTEALIISTKDRTETRQKNYKQLIDFINILNTQNEKRLEELNDPDFVKGLEKKGKLSQYKQSVIQKVDKNLANILRTVQKNYDAHENHEEFKMKNNPNVIFISNPEAIEQYRNGINGNAAANLYTDQLRRQIERASLPSSTSSSSSSSEDTDDKRRNLKDVLQDMRKEIVTQSSNESEGFLVIKRRNQKFYPKHDSKKKENVDISWKEDTVKQKPKKKLDSSNAFDTNQHASRIKKDFGPRKRPVVFQPSSKFKYDNYKPKKDSYLKRNEDYRSYGRTSIPIIGKKAVYDNK